MEQGLRHAEVGVVQLGVLAHQRDGHGAGGAVNLLHQLVPVAHVRLAGVQAQLAAHHAAQALLFQQQRHLVQGGGGEVLDHAVLADVAEQGDLPPHVLGQRTVGAADQHIRLDAHAEKLLYRVLGGLALQLAAAGDGHHQRHMDVENVAPPLLRRHLTDGLQIGLAFDVAHGAADLGDDHVGAAVVHGVQAALDLVGDVGDDLHRAAQIAALTLPVQHRPEYLAGGHGAVAGQRLVHKTLVVPQIQIRLRAVVGDEHLAVLVGAHGAGIHVQVGVKLLVAHPQAALLQQPSQRCGADTLSQTGHHTAGDKYVLHPTISHSKKICSDGTPPPPRCQRGKTEIFHRNYRIIWRIREKLLRKGKFFLHWRADGGMVGLDSPVEGSHTRADRGVRPRVFCRAQRQRKKKAPEALRSQGFRGLARKEGFEPSRRF